MRSSARYTRPQGGSGGFSYGGGARVLLAVVLVAVAAGVAGMGLRLRAPVRLPSPGQRARTVMLAAWGVAIVAFLICLGVYVHQLIHQHLIHSRPAQPVFPVTAGCMVVLFLVIWFMGRSLSMTRTYPAVAPDPAVYRVLFFAPLFLAELTTLALLSLAPLVRLSRMTFFAFALMLLIFAVWALFGLGYPSAPLPFAFNAASKVVAFVVALCLFLPQRGQPSTPEPAIAAADGPAVTTER